MLPKKELEWIARIGAIGMAVLMAWFLCSLLFWGVWNTFFVQAFGAHPISPADSILFIAALLLFVYAPLAFMFL